MAKSSIRSEKIDLRVTSSVKEKLTVLLLLPTVLLVNLYWKVRCHTLTKHCLTANILG